MKFFLVGPGKVGISLSLLMRRAGHELTGCLGRSGEDSRRAREYLQVEASMGNVPEDLSRAEFVLIATSDSAVEEVARALRESGFVREGQVLCHTSGVLSSEVFRKIFGPPVASCSLHPVQSIASVESGVRLLPGSLFTVEGDERAVGAAESLVADIGGRAYRIDAGAKPLYHAALSIASNFMVLLDRLAEDMLIRSGLTKEVSRDLARKLLEGTFSNLREMGSENALTGPVLRGDRKTIEMHVRAIERLFPEALGLYLAGTSLLLGISRERREASPEALDEIADVVRDFLREGVTMNDEDLEMVYRPKDELEGKILEAVLGGEGIPCLLRSRQIPWMNDIMQLAEGFWGELLVPRSDAERAREAIRSYFEGESEPWQDSE